jgi:hypothetical protein
VQVPYEHTEKLLETELRGSMKKMLFVSMFVVLALTVVSAQDPPMPATDHAPGDSIVSPARAKDPDQPDARADRASEVAPIPGQGRDEHFGLDDKFRYYLGETYLNPSFLTAPAFRAGLRMATPPGHFPTAYPGDWRQGAEGFGRNYGDAIAQRISFHTARFATGAVIGEDPRYVPSTSRNPFRRSLHALGYTFIDRSDGGRRMPAFSNFVGAAAAGVVGNSYLPQGFANVTHAGQRATLQFAFFGAGNLYREFAPQMPKPVRVFFELIGR